MRISDWSSDVCSSDLPEKLGLALQVLEEGPDDDPDNDLPAAMAGVLGLTRLRQTTRDEFAVLLRCVGEMREKNEGGNDGAGGEGEAGGSLGVLSLQAAKQQKRGGMFAFT